MFGVGFTEILLILLVALIVLGPEKLPSVARDLARFIAQLKNYSDQLKQEVGLDEFTRWKGKNYYHDFMNQTALAQSAVTSEVTKSEDASSQGALSDQEPASSEPTNTEAVDVVDAHDSTDTVVPDDILPNNKTPFDNAPNGKSDEQ